MSLLTVSVICNGELMPPTIELLSIDVTREYNRIPTATLVFLDGDATTQQFPVIESNRFEAGNTVEIRLSYSETMAAEKTIFKGIIMNRGLRLSGSSCQLNLELSDSSVKMTAVRKSMVYEEMTDDAVIKELISGHSLSTGFIKTTKITHGKLVQYASTDWDFLVCRAEANGLLVTVKDGTVSADSPKPDQSPVMSINFGLDEIYSFEFEADSSYQQKTAEAHSWDQKNQELTTVAGTDTLKLKQQRLNEDSVYLPMGNAQEELVSGVPFPDNEAQAWADARLMKDRMSMLRGRIRITGSSLANVGDVVELKGLSKLFTGNTIVTGLRHHVSGGGWETDLQFGLSAEWFSSQYPVTELPAAGLLPAVNGLQVGIVEAFKADPDNEFRVKVKIPAIKNDSNSIWARLAVPDAGDKHGMLFLPEPGDEVILGFLNDDPRQAIVLGSVFGSKHAPPVTPDEKNALKGITTKTGMKLTFDDEQQTLTISTSDKNQVVINEKEKTIELKDANKNSVKLSAAGIALDSGKDLIFTSSGDVKINASGKVEIKGSAVDVI